MPKFSNLFDLDGVEDDSVFKKIYNTYSKELISLAYQQTNDMELSRDISQEVFLDYWKRRKSISIDYSLRYFLRKAVINQCILQYKKHKKISCIDEVAELVDGNLNPLLEMELQEVEIRILEIIQELPIKRREVFSLSRINQLSHKEIATQLNISKKTIENHISKATKYIKKRITEQYT